MDENLFNYGIMAVELQDFISGETFNILHVCGYENPPDAQSYRELYIELNTDDEFGLVGTEFILVPVLEKVLADVKADAMSKIENTKE